MVKVATGFVSSSMQFHRAQVRVSSMEMHSTMEKKRMPMTL